jgi:hypothetical protein
VTRARPHRCEVYLSEDEHVALLRLARRLKARRTTVVRLALQALWVKTYQADKVTA